MYKIYVDGNLFCDSRVDDLAIINPKIQLEVNKAGSMDFIIPPTHPYYDAITKRMSIISVVRDGLELFEGICTSVSDDFYKQRTIKCEGALSFLNDTMQRPHKYQNTTVRGLLESFIANHNSLCEDSKHFTVGMVTVTDSNDSIYCFSNYESTMKCIKDDLVDDLGGYLRVRKSNGVRYIDYLKDAPNTAKQDIVLGENLIGFDSTLDTTKIATVIIPLGATKDTSSISGLDERVGIASVNDGKDYVYSADAVENFGWIEKVVTWDNVTTPAALKSKAQTYLTDTQFENMVIEAKAIDLHLAEPSIEPFKVMDKIHVISQPHALDRYFLLTKQTINLNKPESDSITLGSEEKVSLTAQTKEDNKDILKRVEDISVSSILDSASKNAAQLITNAGNGYISFSYDEDGHPYELLIMDKPTKEEATKVWRWNIAGLGYSDQGYDSESYGLAMTMDGKINASFITTGELSANRIKGGKLTLGGSSNTNGYEVINNASGTKIVELNNSGISIYDTTSAKYMSMYATRNGTKYQSYLSTYGMGFAKYDSAYNDYVDYANYGMSQAVSWKSPTISGRSCGLDGRQFYMNNDGVHFELLVETSGTRSWPWIRADGGRIDVGVTNTINLYASGEKCRVVSTDDYGVRGMSAYETCNPMFGDVGSAITDEVGICVVEIDDIFSETVDLSVEYQVFLQAYGEGNVYVSDRQPSYFVAKGTPNLEFGWEIKAIQKDYDSQRMTEIVEDESDEES